MVASSAAPDYHGGLRPNREDHCPSLLFRYVGDNRCQFHSERHDATTVGTAARGGGLRRAVRIDGVRCGRLTFMARFVCGTRVAPTLSLMRVRSYRDVVAW